MDKEDSGYRKIRKSYVIDDGWHLPQEIVDVIDIKIQIARKDAYRKVCLENSRHRGAWINADVVRRYAAMSWIWLVLFDGEYIGKVREIGEELQQKYGVTELEAINILNERNVTDYINKYYRIQHRIPAQVNAQKICDDVVNEYFNIAI